MIHNVTPEDLHQLTYGVHMDLMEEWNDTSSFEWFPATMVIQGPYTVIIQENRIDGTHRSLNIATYRTHAESELMSLRIYDHKTPQGQAVYDAMADDDYDPDHDDSYGDPS